MEKASPYTNKVTGVILSGGKNTRMGGRNKAFLEFNGERLINRTVRIFKALFEEVILVTNSPFDYLDQDVMLVFDVEITVLAHHVDVDLFHFFDFFLKLYLHLFHGFFHGFE